MDETTDPRLEFARRLRALQEKVGLSVRRLEVESERTPRRRKEERLRLKRSTIAGMTSRERPVRPLVANFEVFVDTCLRVAAERNIALPPDIGDRRVWDEAYRELRERLDNRPRRPITRSTPSKDEETPPLRPEPSDLATPRLTRRRLIVATPIVLAAVAGTSVALSGWLRGSAGSSPERSSPAADGAYSPLGRLLSPRLAVDDPVWSVATGMLGGEPVAVVGRGDGTVQLWNPMTGRARGNPVPAHEKPVYSIALSAPMAVSASSDGTLRVWDLRTEPPVSTLLGERLEVGINSVALGNSRGATVAVSASDDRTVRIWDPANPAAAGQPIGEKLDFEVKSVAVGTVNGRTVAVSGSEDGTIRLWDVDGGQDVRLLGAHQARVRAVAIGAVRDRTLAVTGGEDGTILTWDLNAPEPTGTPLGDKINNAVKCVAVGSVKGRTVAVASSDDSAIRLWDLATGRPYGAGLTGPDTAAESIAIGHLGDATMVVTGHWDGAIWTWSL